jgi:hypothetical protein
MLNKKIEQLKTEVTSLKIRLRRLEEFLLNFPNIDDYLKSWDADLGDDELYTKAVKIVRQYDRVSVSLIQRRLSIGYARSARLIDMMEKKGIVGPSKGAKPRKVLKKILRARLKQPKSRSPEEKKKWAKEMTKKFRENPKPFLDWLEKSNPK